MQTTVIQPTRDSGTRALLPHKKNILRDSLNIISVQRTCVHDGPGIRTTVFFQGCNLACIWCQNPEARPFGYVPGREYRDVREVLDIIERDADYLRATGGGVTLSGGEPLMQNSESLVAFLYELKKKNISISVETTLHAPWRNIEKVVKYVDLFLVDLKVVGDDEKHRRITGADTSRIKANVKKLLSIGGKAKFRMVIVPGYNNSDDDIRRAAEYVQSLGFSSIELLKYHNLYEGKANRMGVAVEHLHISPEESMEALKDAISKFQSYGIDAECYDLDYPRKKAAFTPRVYDIQNDIRSSEHHLCFEVAKLKTEFYRKNGFTKPNPVHRAERLKYVLSNKKIIIYPKELLVGNFTSKRKGGQVWEEHYGVLFASILHQIHRQKPVAFKCSFRDKLSFYFNIFPFWLRKGILGRVNKTLRDFILLVARASEMNAGFNNNMASIAHFIVNYERVLRNGTSGLISEIESAKKSNPDKKDFYDGMIIALEALEIFAARYARELRALSENESDPVRKEELRRMAEICERVPKHPARTFHEALQSMLFLHIALCIESYENAISPGRLDQILYPYYKKDMEDGIITYEKAKELLALFIIKMDEAILVNDGDTYLRIGRLFETMSTDQTVTMGGLTPDGKDATNDITYMLLDICELQPYAINMTARIHPKSPKAYLRRIAEVYLNGAPMPALYNDSIYIDTLRSHYDTTIEDARNYAIVGCVEPNASDDHFGNTDCANVNVTLPLLQALKGEENDLWNLTFGEQIDKIIAKFVEYNFRREGKISRFIRTRYASARHRRKIKKASSKYNPPASMDELLNRYQKRLNALAQSILADHQKIEKVIRTHFTTPLASTLFKNCVATGMDVNEGGARHNSSGIQGVGITDAGDSLHAIDEVVFKKKLYTMREVIEAIDNNFEGEKNAEIRKALLEVPKFGQDNSFEAVTWVNIALEMYVNALKSVPNVPRNGIYSAGYYALNVSDVYGSKTPALPSGRLAGVPLANSITPHYGMEMTDLTSALNSVAGIDFRRFAPNGTTVTFTVDSALFQGPDGVDNLAGIIASYFKKGGMQFQPNVLNREILIDAYHHPEKYPYLLVRVAGYCAYFNDLSDDLKKIIINRTCYS